jgi:hypothetical protein
MPAPARAGAVIYAVDLARMAAFYEALLGMRQLSAAADHAVLESPDMQLVVHAIPAFIANTITIASPPELREDTPIKLFFTVPSARVHRTVSRRWLHSRGDGVSCPSCSHPPLASLPASPSPPPLLA